MFYEVHFALFLVLTIMRTRIREAGRSDAGAGIISGIMPTPLVSCGSHNEYLPRKPANNKCSTYGHAGLGKW